MSISRRRFIEIGAAAAATASLRNTASGSAISVAVREGRVPASARNGPVIVGSANGIRGVAEAYARIRNQNADTLDAIVAGVNIQELDPNDQSVGLGGFPNEDGVVQLDASCMHGPTKRAGGVAALEDIASASLVAKAVLEHTDHVLLAGAGAKKFVLTMGFKEQNLLTEQTRLDWLKWKACGDHSEQWLDSARVQSSTGANDLKFTTGTCNMSAVNQRGEMSSVTTTSGRSWKIAGRVGDSPITGAGQYCDNDVGAAGSTGRGEANIKACGAFLIVEFMRQGFTPTEACLKTVERVIATTERRLLDSRGHPLFDLVFYALRKDGMYGAASLYEGFDFAVADAKGARIEKMTFRFSRSEKPGFPTLACRT